MRRKTAGTLQLEGFLGKIDRGSELEKILQFFIMTKKIPARKLIYFVGDREMRSIIVHVSQQGT